MLLICYLGCRIAQVCIVFKLLHKAILNVFPTLDTTQDTTPNHLAYVEWFSPIPSTPEPNHQMYKVSRLIHNGWRHASIIPVDLIISSIHLIPRFGHHTPEWKTYSVLELCHTFYINPFSDRDTYLLFSQ